MTQLSLSLDTQAEQIRELVGVVRMNIIMIGLALIAAKEQCDHAAWLPWLKESFGWTQQTAANYMRVAEVLAKRFPEQIPSTKFHR